MAHLYTISGVDPPTYSYMYGANDPILNQTERQNTIIDSSTAKVDSSQLSLFGRSDLIYATEYESNFSMGQSTNLAPKDDMGKHCFWHFNIFVHNDCSFL